MRDTVTTGEVADYLRASPGTIRRLARRGDLPGSKVDGEWRFTKADIDDWIATGGSDHERQVDESLRLAMEEAKGNVSAGRSRVISWEEAEVELGR